MTPIARAPHELVEDRTALQQIRAAEHDVPGLQVDIRVVDDGQRTVAVVVCVGNDAIALQAVDLHCDAHADVEAEVDEASRRLRHTATSQKAVNGRRPFPASSEVTACHDAVYHHLQCWHAT